MPRTRLVRADELTSQRVGESPQRSVVQVLSLVYKMVHLPHLLPPIVWIISPFSPRFIPIMLDIKKLYLSQANTQFCKQSLTFKGGQLWNRLPQDLVNMSFEKFRNSSKLILNCEPLYNDFNYIIRL